MTHIISRTSKQGLIFNPSVLHMPLVTSYNKATMSWFSGVKKKAAWNTVMVSDVSAIVLSLGNRISESVQKNSNLLTV